jgi:hypothetical protein
MTRSAQHGVPTIDPALTGVRGRMGVDVTDDQEVLTLTDVPKPLVALAMEVDTPDEARGIELVVEDESLDSTIGSPGRQEECPALAHALTAISKLPKQVAPGPRHEAKERAMGPKFPDTHRNSPAREPSPRRI